MVHNLHSIINLIKGMVKFSLGDNKRWCNMKNWCTYPHENAVLKKLLLELNDSRRVGILEVSLNELSVLTDQIECTEETSKTTLSEAVVLSEELLHALVHNLLHFLSMANDILLNHVLHGLITSNAADGVSLISSTPTDSISSVEVLDALTKTNS